MKRKLQHSGLKLVLTILLASGFIGCKKNFADTAASTDNPTTSEAPLTAAELAGTHYATCEIVSGGIYGADVNGMSILRAVTLNVDLSYSVAIFLFTGTVCQLGGTQIFNYAQSGTYLIGSVAVTPASATQVKFTASSSSLTMYAGSGIGATWAGYFNSFCPGEPIFSTVGTSSNSMAGRTCLHVSSLAFVFPTFPADGTEFYDVLSLDSKTAPTAILTSTTINLFMMGQYSTYPTTQDFSYGF